MSDKIEGLLWGLALGAVIACTIASVALAARADIWDAELRRGWFEHQGKIYLAVPADVRPAEGVR